MHGADDSETSDDSSSSSSDDDDDEGKCKNRSSVADSLMGVVMHDRRSLNKKKGTVHAGRAGVVNKTRCAVGTQNFFLLAVGSSDSDLSEKALYALLWGMGEGT